MADHRTAEAYFLRGIEAIGRNTIAVAAGLFRQAVDEEPAYVDALFNLGKACKDLGRLPEAADAFRRIVAVMPDDTEAWYMFGNTCHAMQWYEEAERCYRKIVAMHDDDMRAQTNLGVTLQAAGKPDQALAVFANALQKQPEHADLHYNRALSLLLAGRFAEGWKEFEWRFCTSDCANPLPRIPADRWDGAPAPGKTLLVAAEQGVGDTLQFARFIPEVRNRCGKVVVECQRELLPLMRSCRGIDVLVERGQRHSHVIDGWVPLMSLPFVLGHARPDHGASIPYLATDARRRDRWQDCVSQSRMRAKVGIVWAGNPRHKNDQHRSCPPAFFTPMIRETEVVWFSLQKPDAATFPAEWRGIVTDIGPDLEDFADTAAVIERLDVVITVDTAVAHLAGALGKPVWLLLPFAPDWRWMLERSDSPWYGSARLFRQPRPGDWHSVVTAVKAELQKLQRCYTKSVSAPGDPAYYLEYANALREAGLDEHAIRVYRLVVQLDPANLAAWNNLGITLQDGNALDAAIAAFTSALKVDPQDSRVMNNLGFALLERGEVEAAEEWLRRGIAADPGIADLHNNLGNALRERGVPGEAATAYRRALAIRPEFAEAHWNLAQVLLQAGDFEEGWDEYEWRWCRVDFTSPRRSFHQPVWNGEDIVGRTLLVHAEQGFGDALQFVRYVSMIVERHATVLLECQPELVRLFAGIPGVAGVIAYGSPLPAFDLHIPMMSLPRVFRTTLANVPARVPYLRVEEALERRWRASVNTPASALRVGFTWSGTSHLKQLLNRACPLESLLPLLAAPDVAFFSLHKTTTPSESLQLAGIPGVRDVSGELHDFADTAAVLRALDVVISVDTAVAHLAGALGVPVWVMLPARADWRWLLGRSDAPWYPTMRLFRQDTDGEWGGVVEEVRAALGTQIDSKNTQAQNAV
jgi:tetratricopeptide (TPR) repeat protein